MKMKDLSIYAKVLALPSQNHFMIIDEQGVFILPVDRSEAWIKAEIPRENVGRVPTGRSLSSLTKFTWGKSCGSDGSLYQ